MQSNNFYVKIILFRDKVSSEIKYLYKKKIQMKDQWSWMFFYKAQQESIDDLSFRYGCRARNCGVCTVDVNGKPRLACRARVKENDVISPLATLPVIKDLIVKRDNISRQLIGFNNISRKNNLNVEADKTYHNLTACIECYACLDGCPLHKKNNLKNNDNNAYPFGNPFSFLKLQRLYIDPLTPEAEKKGIIEKAKVLGLDTYRREFNKLKIKCGVGIDLKNDVIKPLLAIAYGDQVEKKNK